MSEEKTTAPGGKADDGFLSKVRVPLTLALVALLAVGIYYYFFVQRKSTYMTGRDFRFLAAIGTQFKSALENRGRMLKNLDKRVLDRQLLMRDLNDPEKRRDLISEYVPGFDDLAQVEHDGGDLTAFRSPVPVLRTGTEEPWVDIYYATADSPSGILLQGSLKLRSLALSLFRPRKAFDTVLLADESGKVVYQQGSEDLSVTQLKLLLDKSLVHRARGEEVRSIGALLHGSSESYSVELNGREYRLFVEPVNLPLGVRTNQAGLPQIDRGKVWLICGLISQKDFVYKSLAVSSVLLSSLMGLLVLATLTWPFLKLRLIGETQRIGVLDLLLLCICTVLGLSITTLALLDARSFLELRGTTANQLQEIGNQMQRNINAEIRAAYKVLDNLEEAALSRQSDFESDILAKYKDAFSPYPLAQMFSLINNEGLQTYKGSIYTRRPFSINVYERDYFQKVMSGNTWDLRDLGDGTTRLRSSEKSRKAQPFYLESIWGLSTGTRFAVISKPADVAGPKVAALSIPMLSLVDPVLPPGFHFAVIDNEGETGLVRFHSDPERNLSENFLTETDQNKRLRSAVFARRTETMTIRYWGEDYLAHVTPVTGLPWTIIVLKDLKTLRAVNVATISTTLLLVLLYTGTLALLLIVAACMWRSHRAEWLWPDPQRRSNYNRLSLAYLLVLCGFLIAIWEIQGSPQLMAISIAFPVLALLIAYMALTRKRVGQEAALGLSVVLAIALLVTVSRAPSETMLQPVLPRIIGILLLAGLLVTTGRQVLKRWRSGSESKDANVSVSHAPVANHMTLDWKSVTSPYRLVASLLLLLVAVLPTVGFFKVSHRAESVSLVRHGQLSLAMELKKRAFRTAQTASRILAADQNCWIERRLALQHSPLSGSCRSQKLSKLKGLDVYAAAFYGTRVELPLTADRVPEAAAARLGPGRDCKCTVQAGAVLPEFLEPLLPRSSDAVSEMRELLYPNASDCTWHWQEDTGNSLASHIFHSKDYPKGEVHLISALRQPVPQASETSASRLEENTILRASFGGIPPGTQIYGTLSLLLLIGLIAATVAFITKRIFLINLLAPLWSEKDDTEPATIGRNLFLVGKPRNWSEAVRESFFCIHIRDLEDPEIGWPARRPDLLESKKMILVEGFEFRLRDPAWNQKKLELLEELVGMQERTIVVTSMVSPAMLFSRDSGKDKSAGTPPLEQRWRNLLSFFTIVEDDLGIRQRVEASAKIESPVLKAESGVNSILLPIAEQLDKHVDSFSDEQVLEELGERAEGYYHALWSSCSSEEQVVLEHLAEEGLVNEKSRRVIRRLMARGFIRRDPDFRLMNESFRRFVISSICRGEVLNIEKQAAPSAWDRLRLPLFVGLAGSIGFLLATQQDLLDGLLASITGLTAGIPAIAKLFSGGRWEFPRGQK